MLGCPAHGEVPYERVSPHDAICTASICTWVITEYEWRTHREAAQLSSQIGGWAAHLATGLALVHGLGFDAPRDESDD